MRITIYSAMADHPEYRIGQMDTPGMVGPEWSGEIEDFDGNGHPYRRPEDALERIFRLFNRVTDEDAARLAGADYKLPSLSVGDVVTIEGDHFLVCGTGFRKVPQEVVNKIKANPRDAWMIAYNIAKGHRHER